MISDELSNNLVPRHFQECDFRAEFLWMKKVHFDALTIHRFASFCLVNSVYNSLDRGQFL